MSHGSESDESATEAGAEASESVPILGAVRERFEVPALLAIVAVMLWIRLRSYSNFVRDGEVFFRGNDAWYHLRSTQYVVRNWPSNMPFDPWTNFSQGTFVGQFGTLYDQIVATAALIVGLGDPSSTLVAKALVVTPAVAGALAALPTYLLGKRLAGRAAGLFGAVVLLLLPGEFLRRTLVGFADHNAAEPLFQATAVAAFAVALAVAQKDRPIWELVTAGDWNALRRPALWSALAGVATGLYIWVWPPGILLIGIFAVYLVLQTVSDFGVRSPDHVAFVAVVSMVTTAAVTLLKFQEATFSPTKIGFLHPAFALVVAASAVGLAALARVFDGRTFDNDWVDQSGFGAVVSTAAAAAVAVVAFLDVGVVGLIRTNLLRFVAFSANAETRTIGEAGPLLASRTAQAYGEIGVVLSQYGFTFLTALIGAVAVLAVPLYRRKAEGDWTFLGLAAGVVVFVFAGNLAAFPDLFGGLVGVFGFDPQVTGLIVVGALVFAAAARIRYDAERLFLFVWAAFLTAAAFTQLRFNYYLAVAVAVFNAYFLRLALGVVGVEVADSISAPDVENYQVIVAVAVVALVLMPVLTVPLSLGPQDVQTRTAVQASDTAPGNGFFVWDESLDWVTENTPREGTFGGADNELETYGQYQRPADGDFEYPDGAYGVQSWWDYGHWITTRGERIPNANPFQEGATAAANFLLAPNETAANDVLADDDEGAGTRYVMVDYKMASITRASNSKFNAPIRFYDRGNISRGDFLGAQTNESGVTQTFPTYVRGERGVRGEGGVQRAFFDKEQRYYESTMIRLYAFHGSRAEPAVRTPFGERVLVMDYEERTFSGFDLKILPQGENSSAVRTFPNMTAAEAFVEEDGSAQIGGFGDYPREPVPALEQYRLVDTTETTAFSDSRYQRSVLRESQALGLSASRLYKTTPSWVKTFERVPGATVSGQGAAPNETLTASVQMRVPQSGNDTQFVYRQQTTADENGAFSFTLPYSTTGYDKFGPENGYTNVTVQSTGPYRISGETRTNESAYVLRNGASLNVSEADVNGAGDGEVSVELSERVLQAPEGAQNTTNGSENTTSSNETDENETSGNQRLVTPPTAPAATVDNTAVTGRTTGSTGVQRRQQAVASRVARAGVVR